MVVVYQCPNVSEKKLSVFRTTDSVLSDDPIVLLYGLSSTLSANGGNNSRMQCHVFTPAGFQSYLRLAVSPNSPLYEAVECLPREDQGDEVCRGLAFGLLKYFSELPEFAKEIWSRRFSPAMAPLSKSYLFNASHAATLASRMVQVDKPDHVLKRIDAALSDLTVSVIDVDIVLPSVQSSPRTKNNIQAESSHEQQPETPFAKEYHSFISHFGNAISLLPSTARRTEAGALATGSFTKKQKEKLRVELCELVDTEDSYVKKLQVLIEMTLSIRTSTLDGKTSNNSGQTGIGVEDLFSSSLAKILDVNSQFLRAIQQNLDNTENAAIEDIESTSDFDEVTKHGLADIIVDVTGVNAFAEALVAWFPKFTQCYGCYIDSYPQFCHDLKSTTSEQPSTTHDTRDQQLMSLLIEPIQRLPRYSLYLDNIVKQLPSKHHALKNLETARNIIAEACSHGSAAREQSKLDRLKQLISSWPTDFNPVHRFVTAADVDLIEPPYDGTSDRQVSSNQWILLLFVGHLVMIRKSSDGTNGARFLMTELDNAHLGSHLSPQKADSRRCALTFVERVSLEDIDFSETNGNTAVRISISSRNGGSKAMYKSGQLPDSHGVRVFELHGLFQGKAAQWVSDAIKARMEAQFPLEPQNTPNWEIRHYYQPESNLQILSSIFEASLAGNELNHGRTAPVRILVNPVRDAMTLRPGKGGIEILATINLEENGFFNLTVEAAKERATRDLVTGAELMPVLSRRIGHLLQLRYQVRNIAVAEYLILHNYAILKSLILEERHIDRYEDKSKKTRPASPVKALTNLFAGVTLRDNGTLKKPLPSIPILKDIPTLPASTRAVKSISAPDINKPPLRTLSKVLLSDATITPISSIHALESTFSSHILALHARKGNVVGKILGNRTMADQNDVQNLCEVLLSNPADHERAAQSTVDVLFAAFEKFINTSWKDTMGPIIDSKTLRDMQTKAETLSHLEYEEYVSKAISELAPQNQRAIKAIINLLTDLLEGMGNDGDRGSLIAAMTEIVVCNDDPHAFISLLDRLVADSDIIVNSTRRSGEATPSSDCHTPNRDRPTAGSANSKTPSLSKRFGFGSVNRQNSKTDVPALGSVSRLWNKGGRSADHTIRELLSPTKSGSFSGRLKILEHTKFAEDSTMMDAFNDDLVKVDSKADFTMPSLGQVDLGSPFSKNILNEPLQPVKKKRRSSLSDLHTMKPSKPQSPFKTPTSRIADTAPQLPRPIQASPLTPSLSFATAMGTPSPRRSSSIRQDSPTRNENTPPMPKRYQTMRERPVSYRPDGPLYSKKAPPLGSGLSTPEHRDARRSPSLIPVPKAVLTERKSSGNALSPMKPLPLKPQELQMTSPVKKSRLVNPQKLSEDVQMQQRALIETDRSVRGEIQQLRSEVAQVSVHSKAGMTLPEKGNETQIVSNLSTRLKALENRTSHLIGNLQGQTTALEGHVSDLLSITEKKIKVLDVKLRQSNEENVALYERNNEELMRIFEQVKEGHVVEELRAKLRESMREAEMWKRECKGLNRNDAGQGVRPGYGVVKAGERLMQVTRSGM